MIRKCTAPFLLAAAAAALFATAATAGLGKPAIQFASPSPDDGAKVQSSIVQFAFTYNRTPKQTRSVICAVSGPSSSSSACDTPKATATGSSSGVILRQLTSGAYTLSVKATFTDGGVVSVIRHFVVEVTKSQYDCESAGGIYSTDPSTVDPRTVFHGPGWTLIFDCNHLTSSSADIVEIMDDDCFALAGDDATLIFDDDDIGYFSCFFYPLPVGG